VQPAAGGRGNDGVGAVHRCPLRIAGVRLGREGESGSGVNHGGSGGMKSSVSSVKAAEGRAEAAPRRAAAAGEGRQAKGGGRRAAVLACKVPPVQPACNQPRPRATGRRSPQGCCGGPLRAVSHGARQGPAAALRKGVAAGPCLAGCSLCKDRQGPTVKH
jgi:hypothetical protein